LASIVTLITDFGLSDGYVGMMKGVLLAISPKVQIVDITHDIEPGNVKSAAFVLGMSYKFFPKDTVHLVVVDPGVGTERNALCLSGLGQFFVGPDNGVFSHALAEASAEPETPPDEDGDAPHPCPLPEGFEGVRLTDSRYWLLEVSNTFHGRDIFAPVASHLPDVRLADLGEPITSVLAFPRPSAKVDEKGRIVAKVMHVDRFGNLITSIRSDQLPEGTVRGMVDEHPINGLARTFAEGEDLFPIVGSAGYVEIAERNGNAAARTGARVGSDVVLERVLL
jgi:S-adenosylmethionine hydrolase